MSGWVAAAVVAVGAGIGAVALAQGGTLGAPTEPVSEESVLGELEKAQQADDNAGDDGATPTETPEPTSPEPSGALDEAPTGDAAGGEEIIATDGGTVLARCTGSEVELIWWTPAQGWSVAAVDPGPGAQATFGFSGAGDDDDDDDGLNYTVTCVDDLPVAELRSDDDDADD
ncbi:MAG TPA: hypothetical protein VHG10_12640 [Glycomyces sp.]|nr:hypothetical protein [Glycomyces sp.]